MQTVDVFGSQRPLFDARPVYNAVLHNLFTTMVWIIAIGFRLNLFWRAVAYSVLLWANISASLCTTGHTFQNYLTGSGFGHEVFLAIHLLLLNNPGQKFRWKGEKKPVWEMAWLDRVYWVFSLVHSPRGVDWSYEVANIPPRPKLSRTAFILTRFLRLIWWYFLMDIAQSYMALNPLFQLSGRSAPGLGSQGYILRPLNIMACMTTAYALISAMYDAISLPAVILGMSGPESWPKLFGLWRDAYTVRRFWGRTWHQALRRFVADIGKFFCRTFGFAPGTFLSRYTQLYTAFIISGLMHSFGDLMVGQSFLFRSMKFYVFQAVAIMFEDFVVAVMGTTVGIGESWFTRAIGFAWTFVWFNVSTPWWIDWSVGEGLGAKPMLPVLLTKDILAPVVRLLVG